LALDRAYQLFFVGLALVHVIQLVFFVNIKEAKEARLFDTGKPFQPSLIFSSKARAYLSGHIL